MASILRRAARKVVILALTILWPGGISQMIRALRTVRYREMHNLQVARPTSIPTRYLSIAAIFKDQAPNLAEWLEFHHVVGVEHVYLYDNGSTDSSGTVLEPYIREGFVSVMPWAFPLNTFEAMQRLAYAHAIMNFGVHWRWMAFIDIDEFLFPVNGNSLPATLADYESLPAVAAYWTMYGFNGHDTRPAGLTIENYTKRAPYGVQASPKSIVDPSKVIDLESTHMFDFAEGREIAYDEQKRLVRRNDEHGPSNILRLNHYFTRSREEFAAKVARYAQIGTARSDQKSEFARMLEKVGTVYDDTILRFVPEVKHRLGARAGHNIKKSAASPAQGDARAKSLLDARGLHRQQVARQR